MPWWAHWKSSSYKLKLVAAFLFDTYFDTCFWCKKYLLQLYRKLWKMDRKRKLGFAAIFLSNRYFLNEISVEGKTTSKFYFKIAHYDQYAAQIMRTGNCITLLTTNISLTEDSFWNTNYFEDLTKFVFWTFNKSFLLKIIEKADSLKLSVLDRCLKLLKENFVPYGKEPDESTDEELLFCFRKNGNLKRDAKFDQMYRLDEENRTAILFAVEKK